MNPMDTNPADEGQLNMGDPVDQSRFTSGDPWAADGMDLGSEMGQNLPGDGADAQVQSSLNPSASGLSASDPNVAACPVCGTLVDMRTARDTLPSPVNVQMDTLYFCCARCKADFEQDPQRYGSSF